MTWQAQPRDAKSVPVRVQIIDVESRALDVVISPYLTAGDVTQRLVTDAGLQTHWEDGSRRKYWLRARGRVLDEAEKLQELGVVPYELLHLLPEPPKGSDVVEREPEYPPNRGYAASGMVNIGWSLAVIMIWSSLWSLGLSVDQRMLVVFIPAVAQALLCVTLARHLWGGVGSHLRIPFTGLMIYVLVAGLALVPTLVFSPLDPKQKGFIAFFALVGGVTGVLIGWLAWYGAVEPLPARAPSEAAVGGQLQFPCGICGGPVTPDVKVDCVYKCGRVFHIGCYQTRQALGTGASCSVCGFTPS